jgi:hypothetical protein
MHCSISQRHKPIEESDQHQMFESENTHPELDSPLSQSNLPEQNFILQNSLDYIPEESSFALRKDINANNYSVYETLIRNQHVLNYIRANQKGPLDKNEYQIIDQQVPVINDYFHALFFLSHEFPDLQQNFKWLRGRYPLYTGHQESFEAFLLKDKVFFFECTKMMLKYEEDNLIISMYFKYVKSHQLLIKSVIDLFLQSKRYDLFKKILKNILGEGRFEICTHKLKTTFIKILAIWMQYPDSEPLDAFLEELKIDPSALIDPAIDANITKMTQLIIKTSGVTLNDKIFQKFLSKRRYDFFTSCNQETTFKFAVNKKRSPQASLLDIQAPRERTQH